MGDRANKLLLPWGPRLVIQHVIHTTLSAHLEQLVVVVGHQRDLVAAAASEAAEASNLTIATNERFDDGLSTSICAGLEIAAPASGYLFHPADMPCVSARTVRLVSERLCELGEGGIAVPAKGGRRGNPVAFSSSYREELLGLSGDRGARGLVADNGSRVSVVDVDDGGIFQDLDTPAAYEELRRSFFS